MGQKYGLVIDTSDQQAAVVKCRKFETEAEAKAYAQGVHDAAESADYQEMYGAVSDKEPEIEA